MALSDEDVVRIYRAWDDSPGVSHADLIRIVEAEVRKQDEALIRSLVDAIKLDRHDWEDWPDDSRKAFEAVRARLGGKP